MQAHGVLSGLPMLEGAELPPEPDSLSAADLRGEGNQLECVTVSGASGANSLSQKQRDWAAYYVLTDGNATEASRLAGYGSPSTMGYKCLANHRVMQEVRRISALNINAHIPKAIAALVRVMDDPDADHRAVVAAANSILDRAGLRPKSDHPGVQVNVQINGQAAQAAIADVWQARSTRLERRERVEHSVDQLLNARKSDIVGRMSDTIDDFDGDPDQADGGQVGGGIAPQGPSPESCPIPPPGNAEHPFHPGAIFGDDG